MLSHALRFLSVDAVAQAQSGHPGMPLGMADILAVLWLNHLRHHPKNPSWFNRDRFILSNGHGSMLLYAALHLSGYAVSREDLKAFRQLHSKTPGHPEWGCTPGVETTTGPLGQGLAHGVGMALSEAILAAEFNRPGFPLVDHYTYVFVGDGCLMEGISHEVCSLAGTLGLGKLIVFYDDNGISIDGPVTQWFTDQTAARFSAYGWHVIDAVDGHDPIDIDRAIRAAQQEVSRPSLIMCQTIIGFGSLQQGTAHVHGSPLSAEDIAQLRIKWQWPYDPFEIPEAIYEAWNNEVQGALLEQAWLDQLMTYQTHYPESYSEFLRRINGDLPDEWGSKWSFWLEACRQRHEPLSTRQASSVCIDALSGWMPELFGGSADLSGSNGTCGALTVPVFKGSMTGNYLHYGVREFGMSAMMTGMALHGGHIPFGGTFLVFSDYARNAIRMAALMQKRVIFIYTHDSIGVGEDGPTHQPIEHLAMLRMTPNLNVWRPANLLETAVAWEQALLRHDGPSCLVLSRQGLPSFNDMTTAIDSVRRGGYIMYEPKGIPECVIFSTGSEVQLAMFAAEKLSVLGYFVRVVSLPCVEKCLQWCAEDEAYRELIFSKHILHRVVIEASSTPYWRQWVGDQGVVIGLDTFGASGPGPSLYTYFKITVEHVMDVVQSLCGLKEGE